MNEIPPMPPDGTPEQLAWAESLREPALKTIEVYQRQDAPALQRVNFFQQRLYHALSNPKPESLTVVLALKPNRVGGSWGMVTSMKATMWGSDNPAFKDISPFGAKWPFLKSFRLFSTPENLADVGAIQIAIKDLFPRGKYSQSRGVGKSYNSSFTTTNGWTGDMFSYGQDALAAAGANKGFICMSEPPPKPLYSEGITRLSGNGLMLIECVQMDLAEWLEQMAEDAGGRPAGLKLYVDEGGRRRWVNDPMPDALRFGTLRLDGKVVGEIRVVRGDVEDACREHANGHMAHSAIEAMVAAWPAEERDARKTGKPMKLSGRIYPAWCDDNELDEVPAWHRQQWDEGNVRLVHMLDPHDAKPWAMAWFAVYPNDDVVCFQEWPPFDFSACKQSPVTDLEEYRQIILEMDAACGRPVEFHVIDKLFGNTPGKGTSRTLRKMLSGPCRECLRHIGRTEYEDQDERSQAYLDAERNCKHRLPYVEGVAYKGSVNAGHIIVRPFVGEPSKGRRPKIFSMREYCPNFNRGMRRYAWDLSKKGEEPELINKDFPDLIRNLILKKLHKYPVDAAPPPPPSAWKPIARPTVGIMAPPVTPRNGRPRFK